MTAVKLPTGYRLVGIVTDPKTYPGMPSKSANVITIADRTYLDTAGLSVARMLAYVKHVEVAVATLRGWRRSAAIGLRVGISRPEQLGRAVAVYVLPPSDILSVPGFPMVRNGADLWLRKPGTYASAGYFVTHELGHRYVARTGINVSAFGKPEWATTERSQYDADESFAELFALSNFKITEIDGKKTKFGPALRAFDRHMASRAKMGGR